LVVVSGMKKLNDHAEPTKSKATKMLLSMGVWSWRLCCFYIV